MKFKQLIGSKKGFSLVELMIVVAIIGILSAVAIPNFARFQRKARQSEVKGNLAAYFIAEQSFAAEFSTFAGNFAAIGFKPNGTLNYHLSVTESTTATSVVQGAPGWVSGCVDTSNACGAFGGNGAAWKEMAAGSASAPGVGTTAAPAAATSTALLAEAGAWIGGAAEDTWSIDQNKNITNIQSGVN